MDARAATAIAAVTGVRTLSRNPKASTYISNAGQLNLTRLTDDAVAVIEDIQCNGVGDHKRRCRGRYLGKIGRILETAGYTPAQANFHIREQIIPIAELNINAAE